MYHFNSRKNKSPFGAVCEGEQVTVNFSINNHMHPRAVRLIIRKDRDTEIWSLRCVERKKDKNIFSCSFNARQSGIYFYRFEVEYPLGELHYVGRDELGNAVSGMFLPEWQMTVYSKQFVVPECSSQDIIYHIFVDRFCKAGDCVLPRYGVSKKWTEEITIVDPDGVYRANDFYGGNIKGIISKLDYLESLGVTIIYLSPIFLANSNHRYDTGDYMNIDPMVGTEQDFAELISKAKTLGMEIMLDGVFNHSGSDSIYFNKNGHFGSLGAYQSEKSPYYDWYYFIDYPTVYESWWGITVVPTLNKNSKSLREFFFGKGGVVEKWTSFGVSWRLDVVDELPVDFVDQIRKTVKGINLSSRIIGEVWEDASFKYSYGTLRPYFTKGQLDGVMNYPFRDAIINFALYGDTLEFVKKVMDIVENYPRHALNSCMTMLGSHDTARIINVLAATGVEHQKKDRQLKFRLGDEQLALAVKRLKIAVVLEYMLPGIPSIYYGDEAGMQGFKDPINRRTFPWGKENLEILDYYRKIGIIRKQNREVLDGKISFANSDLLIMKRGSGDNALIIIANPTDYSVKFFNPKKVKELITNKVFVEEEIIVEAYGIMILKSI